MTLKPKTTFGQMGLFIAIILLINFVSSLLLIRTFMITPGSQYLATTMAGQVLTINTLLNTLPDEGKQQQVQRLFASTNVTLHQQQPSMALYEPQLFFTRMLKKHLQQQLGEQAVIMISHTEPEKLWIQLQPSSPYWLSLPLALVNANGPILVFAIILLLATLSIAGGFVVARKMSKPVSALAQASQELGKGITPAKLSPEGPEELQQMAIEFNQMATNVTQLGQDRELMLAGISHDLRTPITRIRLALEMLTGQEKLVSGMVQDIDEMDHIIDQFIQYSQNLASEPEQTLTVQALLDPLVERYQITGNNISTHYPAALKVTLKVSAMKRIMNNVLDNAIQYGNPPLQIEVSRNKDSVRFTFIDHGKGIGSIDPDSLFKPFTRKDTARSSQGSGLGLANVKRLVQIHKGSVWMEPNTPSGLRVIVDIPQ